MLENRNEQKRFVAGQATALSRKNAGVMAKVRARRGGRKTVTALHGCVLATRPDFTDALCVRRARRKDRRRRRRNKRTSRRLLLRLMETKMCCP